MRSPLARCRKGGGGSLAAEHFFIGSAGSLRDDNNGRAERAAGCGERARRRSGRSTTTMMYDRAVSPSSTADSLARSVISMGGIAMRHCTRVPYNWNLSASMSSIMSADVHRRDPDDSFSSRGIARDNG